MMFYQEYLKQHKNFSVDVIISLQGDSVLIDPKCVDEALSFFLNNKFDYVSSALSILFQLEWKLRSLRDRFLRKLQAN